MTANVSGINPNLTFLLTFAILARYGDYRSATLYRFLTDDLRFSADYQTNQQLADRMGVTRNQLVTAMDKLADYGVIWPPEKAGSTRTVTVTPTPTPRFQMWSLQTVIPDYAEVRAQLAVLGEPVSSFMFTSYGYSHQETPLNPAFSEAFVRFAVRVIPPSIGPDQGYVVAAPQDTNEEHRGYFADICGVSTISSCSCSILTTKTTTTTTDYAQGTNNDDLAAVPTPGKSPAFRKIARTVSRRKAAQTLDPLKSSYASKFRPLADLKLIEPERYAEIEALLAHYNKVFGKTVPFNPYAYAATREALVEGKVPAGQIRHGFEVAARDPFWARQSYTTLLKPDRIASFATTKHDRYARNQTQQPDATTETREF